MIGRFYNQDSGAGGTLESYMGKFAFGFTEDRRVPLHLREPALPVGTTYPTKSHDLAYHTGLWEITRAVKLQSMALTETVGDLVESIGDRFRGSELAVPVAALCHVMKVIRVSQIDNGTGSVIIYHRNVMDRGEFYGNLFAPSIILLGAMHLPAASEVAWDAAFRSFSPEAALKSLVGVALGRNPVDFNYLPRDIDKFWAVMKPLRESGVFGLFFDSWLASYKAALPEFSENRLPDWRQLIQEQLEQRQAVIEAAERLGANLPP